MVMRKNDCGLNDLMALALRSVGLSENIGASLEKDVSHSADRAVYRFDDADGLVVMSSKICIEDSRRVRVAKLEDWAEQVKAEVDARVGKICARYYINPKINPDRPSSHDPQGWYGYFGDAGGPLK